MDLQILCPYIQDICLFTFGDNNPISQKLDVASIRLKTRSGRYIPLSLLIVPDIAVPLTNTISKEVVQLPYLRELPLAHPVTTDENFKISLLIGVDHYRDTVEDNIIRGNGPTAMASKLQPIHTIPDYLQHGITRVIEPGSAFVHTSRSIPSFTMYVPYNNE